VGGGTAVVREASRETNRGHKEGSLGTKRVDDDLRLLAAAINLVRLAVLGVRSRGATWVVAGDREITGASTLWVFWSLPRGREATTAGLQFPDPRCSRCQGDRGKRFQASPALALLGRIPFTLPYY